MPGQLSYFTPCHRPQFVPDQHLLCFRSGSISSTLANVCAMPCRGGTWWPQTLAYSILILPMLLTTSLPAVYQATFRCGSLAKLLPSRHSLCPITLITLQCIPHLPCSMDFCIRILACPHQCTAAVLPCWPCCKVRGTAQWHVQFLDGETLRGVLALNKAVRAALQREQHIYTVDKPRFIHGSGVRSLV